MVASAMGIARACAFHPKHPRFLVLILFLLSLQDGSTAGLWERRIQRPLAPRLEPEHLGGLGWLFARPGSRKDAESGIETEADDDEAERRERRRGDQHGTPPGTLLPLS